MSQTPESPSSGPSWATRHKRILIAGGAVLLLLLGIGLGGLYYIRSGRLNTYITNQVQAALSEYGIRAEVGGLDLAWGVRTANVRDVKLYNRETGQLIATLDRAELVIEIPNPFALRLRREVIFKRLDLDNLQAYVQINAQGRSNFAGLHAPPPSAPGRITFDFSALVGALNSGTLHFNDEARGIAAELGNLKANAQPIPGSAAIDLKFGTSAGRVSYEGRETSLDNIDVAARLGEAAADVELFSIRSPLGEVTAGGRVDDYNTPRYNFNLQARAALGEAARIFAPDMGLQGSAAFDGRMDGEAMRFRVNGGLKSDEFTMSGARVRGASIDEINIESDGQRITFAGSQARANSVAMQRNQITGLTATSPSGEFNEGRTQAAVPLVTVARLTLPQGQLAGIALRGVNASMLEGHTQARARQVTAIRLTLPEGHIAGVTLRDVAASLDDGRYKVMAGLRINGGRMSGAQLGPARGQLAADNNAVALLRFNASLLGGSATGDVVVQTSRGGASRLTASLNELRTDDLFSLLNVNDSPLAGTLNGRLNVSWPGTSFNAVSGAITAHLSGQTTQAAGVIPVNGDVDVTARRGVFNVNQLALATDASRLTASGVVSPEGNSDLRFSLTSTRAEELQTIAYSVEGVEKAAAGFKPLVGGDFKLEGQVTGSLSDPAIEADLNASIVGLRDQPIGSLTGHARLSPTEVAFENATLATTDGGAAKFTYAAPRAAAATEGRLDATIDRINVETLTAAAGSSSQQEIISGFLSGEAHLTGLPGSPVGTATINLVDGKVAGQPAQVATAGLVFDGRTARLDTAELRLAQGRLTATGSYDLKSNGFQLQGRADDVDLGQVAASLNATTPVTGVANATFQASGDTDHLGGLQVELTARGQGVTVGGREAGQLSLTAHTNPGGRVDVDFMTGITGRPQAVRASIELRRPGRPIDVRSELADFELAPLVAAFAPGLAPSVAGVLNGRLHVSGPIVNERGEMTAERLSGDLTLNAVSLQARGRTINIQTPLVVALNNSQVTLAQTRVSGRGFDIGLGGTLGLSEGSRLGFTLNGTADLDALGQLSPDLFLGGTVAIDARLGGTVSDPRLGGEVRLSNISFSGVDLPVEVDAGSGRIVLAGDRITLESFTARANEGAVNAKGTVTLDGFRPNDWRLAVVADNLTVLYQGAEATVNANLTLAGNPDRQVLSGTVIIPEGEYTTDLDIGSLASGGSGGGGLSFGSGGQAGGGAGAFGLPPVNLDVRIEAPNSLLIRNEQINTVGTAALTVGGTLNDPAITGRVAVEGGTIKFRSQRYDITTGTLDFPAGGATPLVNILTEGDVSGYHVYVGLVGPIDAMEVTLRSDPDLPRPEILSLVATGRTDSSTLGSQDILASGFGTAASLLSEEFISQPAQSLLGLNRFQIDPVLEPNSNPAARLTIGKQITRDLAFTYSTNVGSEQDQSALVEYTLTNRFSGLASYTQGGSIANGGRTDSAFTIEVRGRRRFSLGFKPDVSTGAAARPDTAAPPRPERRALPPAEVTLDEPGEIKLSDRKLRELIPVETEGFSRPLARLGERNLANYLQEKGYFFATVRSRCEPADCSGPEVHLIYDVRPGQRLDLDDIRIEGTDQVSVSDVSADLQSKEASFFGRVPFVKNLPLIGGLARGITSNDRIRRDRETIRARLADLGFRSARVTSRTDTKPGGEDLILVFQVEQGPRSTVSDVAFRGNTVLTSTELRQTVAIKGGEAFSPTRAREGTRRIKSTYADQGFLDATTQYAIVDVAPDRVRLEYDVTEGARAVVSEVEITGQTKTREASIRRFLAFKPGDVLTPAAVRRTQRDLLATGAFSEVNIQPEAAAGNDPNARRVTVRVTESKPLLMVYGLGYSTDEGPRGLLQLTDTNLFGRANSISLRMRASPREQLAQLQYTDLRIFGSEWAATVSAFFNRNSNLRTFTQRQLVGGGTAPNNGPGFGIDRFVAFLQAERKLSEMTSLRLRYSIENTKLFNVQNIPLEEIARNEMAIRLGLFSAGLTRDSRDSALNPTGGQLASFEHSVAARPFGGNEAFNKSFANYQRYQTLPETTPLLRNTVLAFAARIGLAAPFSVRGTGPGGEITDADRLLPISQRFFSGGATTLRGFKYEQAGPQGILEPRNAGELPTLVPLGGDALVVFNFELRYPLTRRLRLVPFYDLGNVFRTVGDISFGGMTHSIGAGLRFDTPIGPVGVDYGYLLDPPTFTSATGIVLRQPRGVIHIRFGQTF